MSDLFGKTVLITGATGFLGGALALRLASEGVRVRALVRRAGRDWHLRNAASIEMVSGDLTDAAQVNHVVEGVDVIFHVAAALGGSMDWQRRVNVDGTRNIMQAAAAAGVQRVVHVSTISVYGYKNTTDVTEETPMNPSHDPYSIAKAEAETVVQDIAAKHAVPFSIMRPGMIYGPRSTSWTLGMFRIARRNPTFFIGDGSGSAYPIFVDDVVDLMMVLATHPNAIGETFNSTPDPSPTWRDFVGSYSRLAGHDNWFDFPPSLFKPAAVLAGLFAAEESPRRDLVDLLPFVQRSLTYRMDKARTLLNWQPQISLENGITRCIPWLHEIGLLT